MGVQPCFYRVSVKALVYNEDRHFLLVKEENGLWELPGGGLDFGETPQEGLKREIREEMGLEAYHIETQPCLFFTVLNQKGVYIANVLYETRLNHLNFIPSAECVALDFFSTEQVLALSDLYPNVRVFAEMIKQHNSY